MDGNKKTIKSRQEVMAIKTKRSCNGQSWNIKDDFYVWWDKRNHQIAK